MKRSIALLMLVVSGLLNLPGCDNCCNFTSNKSLEESVVPEEAVVPAAASARPIELVAIHGDTFQSDVLESEKLVLVDFYSPSCEMCKSMEPVVQAVASHFDGRITVGKLNVDDNKAIAGEYGVEMIPQFLVFRDGQLVKRLGGPVSQKEMIAKINDALRAGEETP